MRLRDDLVVDIRRDVKAAALRALRRDACKVLLWWATVPTLFYFATQENKYLSPENRFPLYVAIMLILFVIPLIRNTMWRYVLCMSDLRGTVISKRIRAQRVARTDRNVGYVNSGGDMVAVNVIDVIVNKKNGGTTSVTMLGNHLFSVGQSYYVEGDEVERFAGAKYLYNCNAERRLDRPFCLYCGHLGAPNESKCTDCGCTLLSTNLANQEEST
ncbi:MAG: hypothetical protein IJW40_04445 [Clostridia bacterium]|nr:hypothetical protein [Clostridia bacterium]